MRIGFIITTLILISGCSNTPKVSTPTPVTVDQITQWETVGRVGIRTEEDALSGNFNWFHNNSKFDLSIIGPFGQGSTHLAQISPGNVELKYNDVEVNGTSARTLLSEQFGWQFPVEQVSYWIKGLPSPNSPYEIQNGFNSDRAEEIIQDGWTVTYKEYTEVDGLELPSKLQASNPPYRVNLIITQWTIK
ncbi:lipoprotein insertase outer membrane protein LolB [Marinomonas sp. 15G1-11]|uniref:Outer-membrane lipoprotein LolB n=1 Tax=Marinomonas phaeophyticola TaxID=3004091 RepID=A0ABT4JQE6_9GAMM|nr:lipoprotein insertase outer membrane protein LolB [Marinomonas sp. 15G1-11]MCZ2720606.1 lipoprotein insertase outer membrane protein LolB [Marinomonas sp. 15G1-11]